MSRDLEQRIAQAVGQQVKQLRGLSGGCVGEVYLAELADGKHVVVKVDAGAHPKLDVESYMLGYLHDQGSLPVPEVLYADPSLLVMEWVEGDSRFSTAAERHAAELLANLHAHTAPQFGLDKATLIGSLHQPNPWTDSWVAFFRDHRLLYMAGEARSSGGISTELLLRLERFAAQLDRFIEEPDAPSLLHGDVWTTNVLASGDRVTGFIDPAVYYGHPEIELAFITLFNTFGQAFFTRYQDLRPIAPGFIEQRRDIYNLYPLLVHARLFGGGYGASVDTILSRLGF